METIPSFFFAQFVAGAFDKNYNYKAVIFWGQES